MTTDDHSPDKVWQATLGQLQMQMTQATFDTWVKNTRVISAEDRKWQIGTKSAFAKDWLENRLFTTILRTVSNMLGEKIDLKFVVEANGDGTAPEILPVELEPGDFAQFLEIPPKTDNKRPPHNITVPSMPGDITQRMNVHVKDMGKLTGYQPLPNHDIFYLERYLSSRYGQFLGLRTFVLRLKLIALDVRKVTDEKFTQWTPPIERTYEDLAKMLKVNYQTITGKRDYCWKYNEALKQEKPLDSCCGLYEHSTIIETQRGNKRCAHWRNGILDILFNEGLIGVEHIGNKKDHKLLLQVWRGEFFLSPFQVDFLDEFTRGQYLEWVKKHAPRFDFTFNEWEAMPLQAVVTRAADYVIGRELYGALKTEDWV